MKYTIIQADTSDKKILADIRVEAMRESLEAIGRFNPVRARARFLDHFNGEATKKIILNDKIIGFYVIHEREDHIWLDHLYLTPTAQGQGIGSDVLNEIKSLAQSKQKPIRLGALKKSKSNDFYQRHGFIETHQTEWDNFYEYEIGSH